MTNISRDPFHPLLDSDADVTAMWRALMDPLGWHTRRLCLIMVDRDHRPVRQIIEVDDLPAQFSRADADAVVELLGHLVGDGGPEEGGSAALLFARPGSERLTDDDRALCRHLYAAASAAGVRLELLHVGTDTAIVPAPMDEVLPRSA